LGFTGAPSSEPMLFIGQDVVPVKVTHNVAVSMENIVINTKGVFKLLKYLNPHKAT
jgi:hypothetical protein